MKMIALGVPARPATPVPAEPAPRASAAPRTWYARVVERDQNGIPRKLALPLELHAERVPLFIGGDRACYVHSSGTIQRPFADDALLARLRPDVRIVACTTRNGIVALSASAASTPAPAAPQRRAAAPVRTRSSGDPYAHDPHELLYSGHVGRVLRVRR